MAKTSAPHPAQTKSLKERFFGEMKIYFAIALYLWVLLALFALYRRSLLQENGIDYWRQGSAFLNALILGKVLLLGEILKVGDTLRKRALVWVVLGKAVLFAALLMLFHVVEEMIRALIKGLPLAETLLSIGGGSWFGVYVYAAIMFVMLLPLTAFGELSFVLGKGGIWKLMTSPEVRSDR